MCRFDESAIARMDNASSVAISVSFLLNLFVTTMNKQVISQTSSPYLLTASRALTSYIAPSFVSRDNPSPPLSESTCSSNSHRPHHKQQYNACTSRRKGLILVFSSLLYTINITVSNLSLGLVSLSLHQTIRGCGTL